MPIVLSTIRAPECLEAVHVEVVRASTALLLIHIEQLGTNFPSGMGECAITTTLAACKIWISGTETLLKDLWVVQEF